MPLGPPTGNPDVAWQATRRPAGTSAPSIVQRVKVAVSNGRPVRGPVRLWRELRAEAHHLREIGEEGESAATPAISIAEVALFVLPIFCVMLGLGLLAYHFA
jgi:hypothetical protein